METNQKNISKALYILKGLACLCVVIMHCVSTSKLGLIVIELCSFAVPIFYLITGYYSYKASALKIKSRIIKSIKFLFLCILLYFILHVTLKIAQGGFIEYLTNFLSIKKIIIAIFFCSTTIWGPGWYVIGLIETYLVWQIAIKLNKTNCLLKLTPILFIIGITTVTVCNTFFDGLGAYVFIGRSLPWFLEGLIIREKIENENIKLDNKKIILICFVGFFISILPIIYNTRIKFDYLGTILYSMCLFLLFINNNNVIHCNFLEIVGIKYSRMIYAYHKAVIAILIFCFEFARLNGIFFEIAKSIICLFMTITLSIVLTKIKNHFIN